MNAKCPKCGTIHTNLNYGINYSCHVCKDQFHLVQPNLGTVQNPINVTNDNPRNVPSGGLSGLLYLILTGISIYLTIQVLFM